MKRNLAIFAVFDKKNIIHEYVLFYLRELAKIADIIFVADNPFDDTEIAKIKDLTLTQICETHGEYDFGSYKRGFLFAQENDLLKEYDGLILCNDSCFGPFYSFDSIFSKMNDVDCDFWGCYKQLKNGDGPAYVQSYFVYLKHKVAISMELRDFLLSVAKQENKQDVISKYEVGLTQTLEKAGFKSAGLFSDKNNLVHGKCALDMVRQGFPFLKKCMFDKKYFYNRFYCRKIYLWKKVISAVCPRYNIEAMEDYLVGHYGAKNYYSYLKGLKYYYLWDWKRFLFQKKVTKKGKVVIKICKIPVSNKLFFGRIK